MNPITLEGRLAKTSDLAFTPSGQARLRLTVATSKRQRQDDGTWADGPTTWWTVTAWGKTAENFAASSVPNGTPLILVGEAAERTWTAQDGSERRTIEVNARTVAVTLDRAPLVVRPPSRNQHMTSAVGGSQ